MIPENDKRVIQMRKMGYSDAQIEEMLEDDKAVDRGEIMEWDLTPEEHKKAMKYANADEHKKAAPQPTETAKKQPTVYNWSTEGKKRKENKPKQQIIDAIFQFLAQNAELSPQNVQILNKERQISFDFADEKFEITLTQKRRPK